QGPQKRPNSTPETPRPKRPLPSQSPSTLFSPSSFSPSTPTPHKYPARGGRGQVVASFGSQEGILWGPGGEGRGPTPKVFGVPEEQLTKPYKFMFQQLLGIRQVLSWKIEELGAALKSHNNLEDFTSLTLPAQEPVTVLGQIGCDSNGKLNAHSVLLEGDREHSAGAQIPLDLTALTDYSLFPGQVVALEGTNSTGRRLLVSRIFEV
ncbi:DPOA2 polymerase, partial [Rhinopomastus cyanomelas]|nr:DPOA2 polymerase [Rhinopomastus cyanomelas]